MLLFCRSCKFVISMEDVGYRLACAAMIICLENLRIYHVLMSSSEVSVRIAEPKRFWRYLTDRFFLSQSNVFKICFSTDSLYYIHDFILPPDEFGIETWVASCMHILLAALNFEF